jgi:hypothetical protein
MPRAGSVRFVPVGGGAGVDDEGDAERDGRVGRAGHDLAGDRAGRFGLRLRRFEDQLVVHLQEHAG